MPRLVWSRRAVDDLARLHAFLAANDSGAARKAIRVIRAGVKHLAQFPESGRWVEGMLPTFREQIIPFGQSGYLVIYHFDGDEVALLAVRHAREASY